MEITCTIILLPRSMRGFIFVKCCDLRILSIFEVPNIIFMNTSKKILKNARHWLTGNQSGGTLCIDVILGSRGGYLKNVEICLISQQHRKTTSTL